MAQYLGLRSLWRSVKVRVIDAQTGKPVDLSPTRDTIVDIDNAYNKRQWQRHAALGTILTTATNNTITTVASGSILTTLPANTASTGAEGGDIIP